MLPYLWNYIAQINKTKLKNKKTIELDWYNCSFDLENSVYSAEINKTYEYLNDNKKKLKKRRCRINRNRNGH